MYNHSVTSVKRVFNESGNRVIVSERAVTTRNLFLTRRCPEMKVLLGMRM